MFLNANEVFRGQSTCVLTYEEANGWLRATWSGYVNAAEARLGAEAYLQYAAHVPCAALLNDNSQLRGPWFDSFDWLAEVWVPQAARLGLRRIAHVVQADRHWDIILGRLPKAVPFELQVFLDVDDAQQWLRHCGQPGPPNGGRPPLAG